tara:strand:+ start:554 stop:769 length:216 start_codon:yes stop_codon:yes gene_type:complete
MCKFEKNLNRIYTISGIILLIVVIMSMTSCGTGQLTQKQVKINYELDKLYIDYKYKSDSLINEFYKNDESK